MVRRPQSWSICISLLLMVKYWSFQRVNLRVSWMWVLRVSQTSFSVLALSLKTLLFLSIHTSHTTNPRKSSQIRSSILLEKGWCCHWAMVRSRRQFFFTFFLNILSPSFHILPAKLHSSSIWLVVSSCIWHMQHQCGPMLPLFDLFSPVSTQLRRRSHKKVDTFGHRFAC